MTKIIHAISLGAMIMVLNTFSAQAQTRQPLPNGDMEIWELKDNNTYLDPKGWFTLNALVQFGYNPSTLRTTEAHTGAFAALLQTEQGFIANIPGLLSSNFILDSSSGFPDFELNYVPFNSRPDSLEFYMKAYPATGDTNALVLFLTRWDSVDAKRDTIGEASWQNGDSVGQYTRVVIPVHYYSSDDPDSMSMIISSSLDGFNPVIGTKFYIDDLKFIYPYNSGVEEAHKSAKLSVYPNPANNRLLIRSPQAICAIQLYDFSGRLVNSISPGNSFQTEINTESLKPGIYLLKASSKEGYIFNERIIIQR